MPKALRVADYQPPHLTPAMRQDQSQPRRIRRHPKHRLAADLSTGRNPRRHCNSAEPANLLPDSPLRISQIRGDCLVRLRPFLCPVAHPDLNPQHPHRLRSPSCKPSHLINLCHRKAHRFKTLVLTDPNQAISLKPRSQRQGCQVNHPDPDNPRYASPCFAMFSSTPRNHRSHGADRAPKHQPDQQQPHSFAPILISLHLNIRETGLPPPILPVR